MPDLSRRTVTTGMAAAGVAATVGGIARGSGGTTRQPAIYLPHGGGPWPWIDDMRAQATSLLVWLQALPSELPAAPKAIVCVTAHWEARVPTVSAGPKPTLLYDYYGFPPHTYQIQWPVPGAPDVAARIRELLTAAGIDNAEDAERGYDHGTFVPLAVAWPEADVPVVQLSLIQGLDASAHLAMGRALAPLRNEGVLLVGSGMSYHNMRGFGALMRGGGGPVRQAADTFDAWLAEATASADPTAALARWAQAPAARDAHPREEHLLPLMVVAGAAEGDVASVPFADSVLGAPVRAVRYG
jgi:aromatic ring-opening dioxygenase catalytic subunit (LigB family)